MGVQVGYATCRVNYFEQQDNVDRDFKRKLWFGKMLLGINAENNKMDACYRAG